MDEVQSTTPNPQTSPTVVHPQTGSSVSTPSVTDPATEPVADQQETPKKEKKLHLIPVLSYNSSHGKMDESYLDPYTNPPSKLGAVSLIFSFIVIAIFLIPIVSSNTLNTQMSYYIWFAGLLGLGIITLICGLASEKGREQVNLLGLVGVVISIFVIIVCVVIATYYIKYKIEVDGLLKGLKGSTL